jgi:immune inhibitor A
MTRFRVPVLAATLLAVTLLASPLMAMAPYDKAGPPLSKQGAAAVSKEIDRPSAVDRRRVLARGRMLAADAGALAETDTLALTGTDRVLVILVEFGGPDTFTFTPGVSTWDPIGHADATEFTGESGTAAACNTIVTEHAITGPTDYDYSGPLHNQIARPLSADDASGTMIWTQDFSPAHYKNLVSGGGVLFNFTREDGSRVYRDFRGASVANYFKDQSGGKYGLVADVVGWVKLDHSSFWYGADPCPGARSGGSGNSGGLQLAGGGTARDLVRQALDKVNAAYPGFDWAKYDQNGDGVIDRLWIIHAGYGEEDNTTLLNRTLDTPGGYGEGALWSHSSTVVPAYPVGGGISAGPYIMMPENAGIGVLAHEAGHNIGAMDLYAYGMGETSAGFWTLMSDDWTGDPIGFLPPALDPMHLDQLGWLAPSAVITDPTKIHTVKLGQASRFPGGTGVKRGARIALPPEKVVLPVAPAGNGYWWGGAVDTANARMTQTAATIAIPAGGATLTFSAAWDLEAAWDFLWVQATHDDGATWETLTNANTTCTHDAGWIGELNGFPADLCAAGIGGLTGTSASWPALQTETFSLSAFAGQNVRLRFWYMTDWGTLGAGAFIDNLAVTAPGPVTLLADDAESPSGLWTYEAPWERNDGSRYFDQSLYLQWRNTLASGGYDRALGSKDWRYGPANSGLLVWYEHGRYSDNEVFNNLVDTPGFGPKGRMLVVDAHPGPYRDPSMLAAGYPNEAANLGHRGLMRDAPFSLKPSVPFTVRPPYLASGTFFSGRPRVRLFTDAFDFTPGAEFVAGGPVGQTTPRWITRQWDAGTVLPSLAVSGIRAPGYTSGLRLRFACSLNEIGQVLCYSYPAGPGYDGSTGTPGEVDGQGGWNVKIVSQTASVATVQVWNSRQSPKVLVTAPDAGEVVPAGAPYVLGWSAPAAATSFDLAYSLNAGRTWTDIATGVAGDLRSFRWTVPTAYGNVPCLLKVVAKGAGGTIGTARTASPFTIETVRLTAPEGPQTLQGGATAYVTWETAATPVPVASVELSYSLNGGATWTPITTLPGTSPGAFAWTLPAVPAAKPYCAVQVVLKDGGGAVIAKDKGNRLFRIKP